MVEIIILIVSVFASSGVGLFVYARNPRHLVNRLYAVLTLLFTLFPVANYLSLHANHRLLYIRAVVFITTLAVGILYYLVYLIGSEGKPFSRWQRLGMCYTIVVAVLTFTPLVFSRLGSGTASSPIPGIGAGLFVFQLIIFLANTFVLLTKRIRLAKGVQHQQYSYMLVGMSPLLFLAPITGFILPILFKNVSFIVLSPLYAAFFVCMIGFAIIRHNLFDIRTFVVRAVAYAFSVMVMTLFYIAPGVLLLIYFFDIHLSLAKTILLIIVTYILAVIYLYMRSLFDKLTTRIFFRNTYESQDVLHHLSELLVRTTDLDRLQLESRKILMSVLRVGSLEYWFDRHLHKEMFALLHELPSSEKGNVLILSQIQLPHETERAFMQKKIAAVVRLRTTQGILGYMTMDYKASGASFSQQDIRLLGTAADEIAISMQNALHFEEIRNFNETLQQNVNEATYKLRKTNEKLQNLDATKDEFITMASHQLRTPLTAVKGYLSMVLEGDAGKLNASQRKLLEQSYVSAQRMVYLIADLLNLSRLSTGKFIVEAIPTNLADVVQAEIDQLTQTAKSRDITLLYDAPPNFPALMLDETKIHQVVMNFIDNAIYYTPAGGTITVELIDTPSAVEYRVHDTGIGVPRHEQRHLFTKFFRAENARQARPDGTGLGLFMAKKVVAAQGGAIIFESIEGQGSTFGFRFNKRSHQVPSSKEQVSSEKEQAISSK